MKLLDTKYLKIILTSVIVILLYKLIDNYKDVLDVIKSFIGMLGPFIAGIIIAFFLSRPVSKAERFLQHSKVGYVKRHAKGIATLFVYVVVILIIFFILMFIVPRLYKNAQELVLNLPKYYEEVSNFVSGNEHLSKLISMQTIETKFFEMINMKNVNKWFGIVTGIANSFVSAFVSVVISIYLILEKETMFSFFRKVRAKFFKSEKIGIATMYGRKVIDMFYTYISSMLTDALIMGVIVAIVLSLFKVPYAALLGLLVGIGNMIPFFGAIISSVIVAVITAVTTSIMNAVWVSIFMLVLAQVDSNLIQPRILSSSTGISPLLVLLSVLVFGGLFGIPGMIIGVPVCAVLKMVVIDYMDNGRLDGSNDNENEEGVA